MLVQPAIPKTSVSSFLQVVPPTALKATDSPNKNVGEITTQYNLNALDELLSRLLGTRGKKSFLVFRDNIYVNVLTESIAYFYVRYESSIIVTFDKQEYFVNYSLEQIQQLVSANQFYRINRQYLINFDAVKETEHYFARKLLVNLDIPTKEKLIVSREKANQFLGWLDNR